MKNRLLLFLILATLVSNVTFANNPTLLEVKQVANLPHSEVNYLYEDKKGFIWIATLDGLYRYDGRNYVSYLIDGSENSISSNQILAVNEDHVGNIWIGTYGRGVSKLDPKTGNFTNYSLRELTGNDLWVESVGALEIDKHNRLWIGNISGVVILELDKSTCDVSKCSVYPIAEQEQRLYDFVTKIHEDRLGQIWIGSNRTLKRVIEQREGELICERMNMSCVDICDYDENSILTCASKVRHIRRDSLSGNYIERSVILDEKATDIAYQDGAIWLGGFNGVKRATKHGNDNWKIDVRYTKETLPFALATEFILDITTTRDGQIWAGTRGGGVLTFSERIKHFNNYPYRSVTGALPCTIVNSICEDQLGNLWVGTNERGVFHLKKGMPYLDGFRNVPLPGVTNIAFSFGLSGDGQSSREVVWLGLNYPQYLTSVDPNTMQVIPQSTELSRVGKVISMVAMGNNTLWVGSYNRGLWRLRLDDNGVVVEQTNFRKSVSPTSISSNIIRSLFKDSHGDLWIGTDDGIDRLASAELDSDTPRFYQTLSRSSRLTLDDYYILQISEHSSGDMLFGSSGGGLIRYNAEQDKLKFITTQQNLATNSIKSIIEDPLTHDLWVSTNVGISRYTPSTDNIVNYDSDDGILNGEFSNLCSTFRSNGDMLFGNRMGFIKLNPQDIQTTKFTPQLFFIDLYVNHELVEIGETNDGSILTQKLEYTKQIDLTFDQRNFAIEFGGLNFLSPLGNKYTYKLEGVDKSWREIRGDETIAQYTNIHEGNYTFRVRAANSDGVCSQRELSLDIRISPPLQRSTIAYIIYILLILLILYVIILFARKRQEVMLAQMERQKSEDIIQYKLEFFMNVSHEFRTPLTLITIPLDNLIKRASSGVDRSDLLSLTEIRSNVDVLMSLINQLLDFRKIERGKERVELRCVDLNQYVAQYYNQFVSLAQQRNMSYTLQTSDDVVFVELDERLFEKVMHNVLSNAFKYTSHQGCVTVTVKRICESNLVELSISDNGCGVSAEEMKSVFDRFYQSKNSNSSMQSGSGIGLALCRNIVKLHSGNVRVASESGVGFTLIIELPLSRVVIGDVDQSQRELQEFDQADNEEVTFDEEPSRVSDPTRRTILIVEDNDKLRRIISKELMSDYNIIEAQDGVQGLSKCRENHPNLVITDIMMPLMDGVEMCRLIKESEEVSHTPIIVLTANATVQAKIDSFTIGGADGYLEKPFSVDVLKGNVKAVFKNRDLSYSKFQESAIINPMDVVHSPADLKCITKIISIIKNNIDDSELSMEYIAGEYGVTRTYLNRKIKSLTGVTSTQFLRTIRMKYAAKLLMQKTLSIAEISNAVGYTDANTFRLRFKDIFGVSPSNYNGERAKLDMSTDDKI